MPEGDFPIRFDLRSGFSTTVHLREVTVRGGSFACWTYVSEGLAEHGQKELVLTLRSPPEAPHDSFPQPVLELFAAIYDLAAQGRIVDEGDYTEFGPTGFLGNPSIRGLVYLPYQDLPGIQIGGPGLSAILVPADELESVKAFGVSRLMARLGQAASHFPCPDWSDPTRASVITAADLQQSVLTRMPTLKLSGASVTRRGSDIVLDLASSALGVLSAQVPALPREAPLALLTQVPATADSLLVWQPRQKGPVAITAPGGDGSVMAGCFCAFLPKQPTDDARVFEDGFVLMLTKTTWRRVRDALTAGSDLDLPPGPGGLSFTLRHH